jgi:hypothetical protein
MIIFDDEKVAAAKISQLADTENRIVVLTRGAARYSTAGRRPSANFHALCTGEQAAFLHVLLRNG